MGCEVSGRQIIIRLCKQESEVKMVSPATVVAATRSASDTNFRSSKESGSACYGRGCNDLPRPILIFVAAEKNGFACSCRGCNDLPRPILIFVAAEKVIPPATAVAATVFRVRY